MMEIQVFDNKGYASFFRGQFIKFTSFTGRSREEFQLQTEDNLSERYI